MHDPELERTGVLVQAAQRGDRDALNALFTRYAPIVRRIVALRLGRHVEDLADVDDVIQESLLNVFKGLEGFELESEGSFRAWLARCVQNKVNEHHRSAKALKRGGGSVRRFADLGQTSLSESILPGHETTPSQLARAHELDERIERAMLELSDRHREAIVLRKLCEMSYAEVAAALGLAQEATARAIVSRALARLKELL